MIWFLVLAYDRDVFKPNHVYFTIGLQYGIAYQILSVLLVLLLLRDLLEVLIAVSIFKV